MPIIIDANCADKCAISHADAIPILRRLSSGKLSIVTGGKNKCELLKTGFRSMYSAFQLAGRLTEFPKELVENRASEIADSLSSDDGHIIGLALASGGRVLYSEDVRLHRDFRDPNIVSSPRGHIYKNASHENLLDRYG